ncbi:acriflavine resistance protein B [Methylopila jiangsuensis]|uniref:Acriflavine resistance protein B n=1 Tax=Methylopila jiangsuensis TaxID=586230 RepID=A0A9W6N2D5_9HYPH|nr:efflux RND transporter permease subunit [Methylopila jiangsuensis]MDR6285362.1 multidrug efflux pump [Methylopila jiangsuensis]GLK75118.1 acriflavine resistance protein B [Methylopila jiangsuensis]
MSVSAPFIARPVATTLLAIAVLLAGLLGYSRLPVSSLPQVDFPTIQVSTRLPGANPQTMSSLVTAPLERQLGQIPSLEAMTSTSSFGRSQITLRFDLDRDIDGAAQDVQAAINAANSTLPRNLPYPPVFSKVNPANTPVLSLALTSETLPMREVSDLADTLVAQRLAEVAGVGRVAIGGGVKPAIRIQADIARLASYGLTLETLRSAVTGANTSGPKGSVNGPAQAFTISANDQIEHVEVYRDLIVAMREGSPVRLRDVAEVTDGLEDNNVAASFNGRPAIVVEVLRQPGANTVETVESLRRALPALQRAMPAGVDLHVVDDRTDTIRASIHEVEITLALSVGLIVLVVLLFLRTLRATLIAGVALPLSLIASFAVMWAMGFSLDNLSLMALVVGAGFVVDDAIVMIENVARHIEEGASPLKAAYDGAREIGFTIVSLTASLVAVFIPLLFMGGLIGRLFREFAATLAIAVVVSMVISLTLTPMMCAKLLKAPRADAKPSPLARAAERATDGLVDGYRRSLLAVLRHKGLTLALTLATLIATGWLYVIAPKGFMPEQDVGLVTATVEAAQDVSFEELKRLDAQVTAAVQEDADVRSVVSVLGVGEQTPTPNAGRLSIVLKPHDQRAADANAVIARLQQAVAPIPGVSVAFQAAQELQISARASRGRYQYTLTDSNAVELARSASRLVERLQASPVLGNVGSDARPGGLQARVAIDRLEAGRLGVTAQAVADALNDAFGQRQISTIYGQSNQYRVILEAAPSQQKDPAAIGKLYVTSSEGVAVPLAAVARVTLEPADLVVSNQEQFPAVTLSFDLAEDASLSDAVAAIAEAEAELALPSSIVGAFSGDAAEFAQSLAGQPWLVLAAVIAIYIVLGVLYESFIHPLTILSTLPSAGVGALIALELFGLELSIVALIGVILLMGIVKKNAIMMIDFALDAERTRGLSPEASIVEAAALRFRPIMMTTLAALLGALPLALATGPGAELRVPLGVTIIGGLLLSQLLTLYTTPVVYLAMERLRLMATGARARPAPEPAE